MIIILFTMGTIDGTSIKQFVLDNNLKTVARILLNKNRQSGTMFINYKCEVNHIPRDAKDVRILRN